MQQPMVMQPQGPARPFPQHLAPHFAQMGVPMEQAMNYWATFNLFDIDGSGTINAAEMATGLQLMGQCPTPSDIQNMMAQADNNQDSQVDFLEYVRATHGRVQPQQSIQNDLQAAFRVFDKDGSGYLDASELKTVLCHRGMQKADFDRVMSLVDVDGDGRIDYCEFARLMSQPLHIHLSSKHSKDKKKHKKSKRSKKSKRGGGSGYKKWRGSDYDGSDYSGSDYSGSDYTGSDYSGSDYSGGDSD